MKIALSKCLECGFEWVEKKVYCPNCLSDRFEDKPVEGRGRVYSHTTIHAAPKKYKALAPYIIALIDLQDNIRLSVRCGDTKIKIGDFVQIVELEDGAYIAKKEGSLSKN